MPTPRESLPRVRRVRLALGRGAGLLAYGLPAGFLLALQLVYLLLGLNPELPVSLDTVMRTMLWPGTLGMVAGAAVLAAATGLFLIATGKQVRLWPPNLHLLAWLLAWGTAALAVVYWFNTIRFQLYLPPRANRTLVKSSIVLTAAALMYGEVALFHSLRHHRFRAAGRGLLALATLALFVFLHQRQARPDSSPSRPAGVAPAATAARQSLIVVGIEGASFDDILPMARNGALPFFSRLVEEGSYGRLASVYPQQRLSAWTSLATGKLPYKHGMKAGRYFVSPLARSGEMLRLLPRGLHFRKWGTLGSRAVATDARHLTAKPLWSVLPEVGVRAGVANWPVSAPAAPTGGFFVPPGYFSRPPQRSGVEPAELAALAPAFDLAVDAIDPDFLGRFAGNPGVLAPGADATAVVEALREDLAVESLSFTLVDPRELRFGAVVLGGLRRVNTLARAAESRGLSSEDRERWNAVVRNYYGHLDEFLAELWLKEGSERTLVVVSAVGEESVPWRRELRQMWLPSRSLATTPGASDGVFFLLGPGIRAGRMIDRATILDVAPTLLFALGLPVARDMDGGILVQAFDDAFLEEVPVSLIPTYEDSR